MDAPLHLPQLTEEQLQTVKNSDTSPAKLSEKFTSDTYLFRYVPLTDELKKMFICRLLVSRGNIRKACEEIGISRTNAYNHRRSDPHFAELWNDALEACTDDLIEEADRRAREGTLEPVFYKGQQCGAIQRYSDSLMQFLIKGRRKEYNTSYEESTHKLGNADEIVSSALRELVKVRERQEEPAKIEDKSK